MLDFLLAVGLRIASLCGSIHREPQDEYKIYRIVSLVRRLAPSLFVTTAYKIESISLGEELSPADMALDVDTRLGTGEYALYVCAEKLIHSEMFSHFFPMRLLDRFITSCCLPQNETTYPQVFIECDTPFTGQIPGVPDDNDSFARYFRKAFSRNPHVCYQLFQKKKDFSRIFFKKDELFHFMSQSPTVKNIFYFYLVRNAELLRGIGREIFAQTSLKKLRTLRLQYPKVEMRKGGTPKKKTSWRELSALIMVIEGKTNTQIAKKLDIKGESDVRKDVIDGIGLAFQHNIFQLDWLTSMRERGRRKKEKSSK